MAANATNFKSVAVLGGTGLVGRPLVPELLDAGFDVTVVTRRADAEVPAGARTAEVKDPEDAERLAEVFKGIDVVVSVLNYPAGAKAQGAAIEAAARAGVKRFVLSEFGLDHASAPPHVAAVLAGKKAAQEHAAKAGLEWSGIATGFFIENLAWGPFFTGIDAANGTAKVLGDGNAKATYTSLRDIAKATAAALKRKDTANRYINIGGQEVSDNELIATFENLTGKKFAINHVDTAVVQQALAEKFDFIGFLQLAKANGHALLKNNELAELVPGGRPYTVEDYLKATKIGTETSADWYDRVTA
ncbi:hypothetical protein DFJ74DRAFT_713396 [Hyaloraphidium curvatum]|nr:hypothetical protein DFJ74DRAFT_713396 [Hyaloraphidium curvatum]